MDFAYIDPTVAATIGHEAMYDYDAPEPIDGTGPSSMRAMGALIAAKHGVSKKLGVAIASDIGETIAQMLASGKQVRVYNQFRLDPRVSAPSANIITIDSRGLIRPTAAQAWTVKIKVTPVKHYIDSAISARARASRDDGTIVQSIRNSMRKTVWKQSRRATRANRAQSPVHPTPSAVPLCDRHVVTELQSPHSNARTVATNHADASSTYGYRVETHGRFPAICGGPVMMQLVDDMRIAD